MKDGIEFDGLEQGRRESMSNLRDFLKFLETDSN